MTAGSAGSELVSGVVIAAVAVVAVAIAISSGGGSKSGGLQTGTKADATVSGVETLLTGIPQNGNTHRLGQRAGDRDRVWRPRVPDL